MFFATTHPTRYHCDSQCRFMAKVALSENGCWIWRSSLTSGYGAFRRDDGRLVLSHRHSFELHHGPIAKRLLIRHKCDNRLCCNPDHLELGTERDNSRDMMERGRNAGQFAPGFHSHNQRIPAKAHVTHTRVRQVLPKKVRKKLGVSERRRLYLDEGIIQLPKWCPRPKTPKSCSWCRGSFLRIVPSQQFCSDWCLLWSKVAVSRSRQSCWEWTASIDVKSGYAVLSIPKWCYGEERKATTAHRFAYELFFGKVSSSLVIRHTCDNRRCCNPDHLIPGTHTENMADMISRGRGRSQKQTHCKHGHQFDSDNTVSDARGNRRCRKCARRWAVESKERGRSGTKRSPGRPTNVESRMATSEPLDQFEAEHHK